jgi:NAD+ synthase
LNQAILDEIINQDYAQITQGLENFIQIQVSQNNSNGLILGMSGGIDSAVIAYLCARQLKEKTHALIMPDTDITPKSETEDALKMIHTLGIDYKLIDIKPIVNSYSKYLEPNDWAIGNLRARIRTNILYYYANSSNYLVTGSSDKSEYLIGYFTKFGDGASDIVPIISLYKLQVRKIAQFLGVPENVVAKKSSPHLWKEHAAETEIGVSYEEIDAILYCVFDKQLSLDDTAKTTNISMETVQKIYQLHQNSEHKRESSVRTFGEIL